MGSAGDAVANTVSNNFGSQTGQFAQQNFQQFASNPNQFVQTFPNQFSSGQVANQLGTIFAGNISVMKIIFKFWNQPSIYREFILTLATFPEIIINHRKHSSLSKWATVSKQRTTIFTKWPTVCSDWPAAGTGTVPEPIYTISGKKEKFQSSKKCHVPLNQWVRMMM